MFCRVAVLVCVAVGITNAQDKSVDFSRDVLPILSNKCFVCHGPDTADNDMLRLDSFKGATADRGGYQAINSDHPEKSEVLKRIHSSDEPMPPAEADKQLTPGEKKTLSQWIRSGGRYQKHWAFLKPTRRQIAAANPIDEFIDRQLTARGIEFAPPADRATLARRLALVLTGLPPEPEALSRFLSGDAPDQASRLIEELMRSPRFGEHQARYWLDAVRYGDTHGLHLDNRRGIYPYRDWVVKAFNDNLPLDEFITWQLAGDLLPEPNIGQLTATGYVRLNPSTSEGGAIPAEFQMKNNFDRVETLGTVFLGMSLTCARCHTHKYDPVPQSEYYALLAFFNSTAEPAMDGNKYEYGPTARVPTDQTGWAKHQQMLSERADLLREAAAVSDRLSPTDQKTWQAAAPVARLKLLADGAGSFAATGLKDKSRQLYDAWTAAEKQYTTTLVARDLARPRRTFLLHRGEYNQPRGEPLEPGVLSVLGPLPDGAPQSRLGLARWLTSPDHPLVSRVIVNRIWQRVFGAGLVRTPEDFGLQGEYPTHPELLDWLALELQDSGWDLRHMLRLMVTSRTFRQSSARRTDIDDPENRLLARGPSYRLDAEVIRDIGLWSSGLLDPHMGGEGVKPYQPAGMWKALAHPGSNTKQYQRDKGRKLYRRSLYVYWKRTSPHPMMTLFDAPDRESSCVRRSRTNTALQSLGLFNETQRVEIARCLAERLLKSDDNNTGRLDRLFRMLAARSPSSGERRACLTLLHRMVGRYQSVPADAAALLTHGDAPRDNTLDAGLHAAWTQVVATVLASDPAISLY